jgi:hypothetical protein
MEKYSINQINKLIEKNIKHTEQFKNIYDPSVSLNELLQLGSTLGKINMLYEIQLNITQNDNTNYILNKFNYLQNINYLRNKFFTPYDILLKLNDIEELINEKYKIEYKIINKFLIDKAEYKKTNNNSLILKRLKEVAEKHLLDVNDTIELINIEIDSIIQTIPNNNSFDKHKKYTNSAYYINHYKENILLKIKKFYEINTAFINDEIKKHKKPNASKAKPRPRGSLAKATGAKANTAKANTAKANTSKANTAKNKKLPPKLKLSNAFDKITNYYSEYLDIKNNQTHIPDIEKIKKQLLLINKIIPLIKNAENLKLLNMIKQTYTEIINLYNS